MRVRKLLLVPLLAGLLLSASGCASAGGAERGEAKIIQTNGLGKSTTYRLQSVEPAELSREAGLSVSVSWRLERSVRTEGAEKRIKTVCVKRGQYVEAGEPIFILQGLGSQADVELKQLEISAFESGREETLAAYQSRIEDAEAMTAYSRSQEQRRSLQVEYAQLEYRKYELQSENTLESLRTQLRQLEEAAGETVLVSPVAGTVSNMNLRYNVGDMVPGGTELCTVKSEEGLRFYGESNNGCFVYGREITLEMNRGNKHLSCPGRVVCSPEVAAGIGGPNAILMEFDVKEEDLLATTGEAQVTFTILEDAFVVPKNCISSREGNTVLNLLIGDTVCARNVVRGPTAGGSVAILQGLREGDQVVISSFNS